RTRLPVHRGATRRSLRGRDTLGAGRTRAPPFAPPRTPLPDRLFSASCRRGSRGYRRLPDSVPQELGAPFRRGILHARSIRSLPALRVAALWSLPHIAL